MDCPSCGHLNREGARFCAQCASALIDTVTCPSCGTANPPAARHCDSCGQALADAAAIASPDAHAQPPEHLAEKIRSGRATLEGERKQVTVLFADVMGSMELAEQSDPEEWQRVMDRFFSILCEGVHRFEGTVDKFTGDGIMALFGAPIAHEDHARRACYAALHLQRELAAYAAELRRSEGLNFSVRMGLNSGEVVVGAIGEDLGMEYTAIGRTVGLAQRMEQLAAPDSIYLTEHTASLVEGYVALTDLGEFQVKGVSRPLRVHELTGIGAARGRLDVSRARGFTRFVGRNDELGMLESAREQAFAGQGQVIGIVGEAGVGKSRLCHEFAERYRARGVPVYHVAGQAHAKSVPLLPVIQLLRNYFEIGERDSERTARERIAGKLVLLDKEFDDDLPLIFDFLAVPDPLRPPPRMDPEARQRQLLSLIKRLIHAESARQPGITLVEDLHWLDPASEVFLANQVEAAPGTRSLVVLNFRPEYHAPWMSRSYYRQIALSPLGPEAIEEMLSDLLGSDPSLDGFSGFVRERTEGNPFFIEELVQSLVEAGSLKGERGAYWLARPVEETAVPASVQAILSARIDRLAQRDKVALQAAAVIGKEFSQPVLERVVDAQQSELEDSLRNLAAGEFIYEQEIYPEALYAFKHPLTQEVAYGSQLGERRGSVHAAVARAIVEQYPERLDERAALLAQHWEAAGDELEAMRWHARAAAWSGTNEQVQALGHWRRVRELADALAESAETLALGVQARIALLNYGWRLGISGEEAEALFQEAERMAAKAGDVRSRAMVLYIYGTVRGIGGGELKEYAVLVRRALALAEESGDAGLYVGVAAASYAFFITGEYRECIAACDRAIELAQGDPAVGTGLGMGSPYAQCLGIRGMALEQLGELAEGRRAVGEDRKIARDRGDIEVVGWSHQMSALTESLQGDAQAALAHAQRALDIAERIGNSFSRAWSWLYLAMAERLGGEVRRAVEALERSGAIAKEGRTATESTSWRLALLGESHLDLGDPEKARAMVTEAVEIARAQAHPIGEVFASVSLARVLLRSGDAADREQVGAALARALELTGDVGGKAYEPFVRVELAELARQSGDEERRESELREAHRLFMERGASSHAERLSAELALPAS